MQAFKAPAWGLSELSGENLPCGHHWHMSTPHEKGVTCKICQFAEGKVTEHHTGMMAIINQEGFLALADEADAPYIPVSAHKAEVEVLERDLCAALQNAILLPWEYRLRERREELAAKYPELVKAKEPTVGPV